MALLVCSLDVFGFAPIVDAPSGRSSVTTCPPNKCLMANGKDCGKYYDDETEFCYSNHGKKGQCEDGLEGCREAPSSGFCSQYRRWVEKDLTCPKVTAEQADNIFCMTGIVEKTDVTGSWCGGQTSKEVCEDSYFTYMPVPGGQTGYYECAWDDKNGACTPETRGEYSVVKFCSPSCSMIEDGDVMLASDTKCGGPAGEETTERLTDKDTCEAAYYQVDTPVLTSFPCVYQAGSSFCSREIMCPGLAADQPCISACNCVAASGCSNVNSKCCKTDSDNGEYSCVSCADLE